MSEHPILFSGPMVRAILNGTKTETRRVIKDPDYYRNWQVGDQLWLRETFARMCNTADPYCWHEPTADGGWDDQHPEHYIEFRADTDNPLPGDWPEEERGGDCVPVWKPSIHMPRKHSRIQLEITSIKTERLAEISTTAIIREGIPVDHPTAPITLRQQFATLWDAINAPRGYGWDTNPKVKAICFRRLIP